MKATKMTADVLVPTVFLGTVLVLIERLVSRDPSYGSRERLFGVYCLIAVFLICCFVYSQTG